MLRQLLSFFATLECELIDGTVFENRTAARLAVFDFIGAFFNPKRRHSSIGNLSPVELVDPYRVTNVCERNS